MEATEIDANATEKEAARGSECLLLKQSINSYVFCSIGRTLQSNVQSMLPSVPVHGGPESVGLDNINFEL